MQEVIDFISNTPKSVGIDDIKIWGDHPMSITVISVIGVLIMLLTTLIIFILIKKKKSEPTNQITISMPSMKKLLAKEPMPPTAPEDTSTKY
jgi:hypothetical protein